MQRNPMMIMDSLHDNCLSWVCQNLEMCLLLDFLMAICKAQTYTNVYKAYVESASQ